MGLAEIKLDVERNNEYANFSDDLRTSFGRAVLEVSEAAVERLRPSPFANDVVEANVIEAGAGHLGMAKAFVAAAATGIRAVLGNPINPHLNPVLGPVFFGKGYEATVRRAEWVYRIMYNNLPNWNSAQSKRDFIRNWLMTPALREALVANWAKANVSFHPVVAEMYNILHEDDALPVDVKLPNFVPDLSINKAYNVLGLTGVASEGIKQELVAMGKDPDMVVVVKGFPAAPQFSVPYRRSDARAVLNQQLSTTERPNILGGTAKLIVAVGGGNGAKLDQLLAFLPDFHPSQPIALAVICGSNTALYEEFEKLRAAGTLDEKITLVPRAKVSDMHLYLRAADGIIGKPGASFLGEVQAVSVAEIDDGHLKPKTLASYAAIAGQEDNNKRHGIEDGWLVDLKLQDLNGPDGIERFFANMETRGHKMRAEFFDAKNVALRQRQLVQDYIDGKIKDSPREIAERARRQEARFPIRLRSKPAQLAFRVQRFADSFLGGAASSDAAPAKVVDDEAEFRPELSATDSANPHGAVNLRFLQYNVFNRAWPMNTDNQSGRAKEIGKILSAKDFDIIALSESNKKSDAALISEGARANGLMHQVLNQPNTSWRKVNGGVSLLSRYPIESSTAQSFTDSNSWDSLADKGFVHAVVAINDHLKVNVIATHTNADNAHPEEDAAVRQKQFAQIKAYTLEHVDMRWPIVLLGDMNVDGMHHDAPEYARMLETLGGESDLPTDTHLSANNLRVDNGWGEDSAARLNTYNCRGEKMKPAIPGSARYDYILHYFPSALSAASPATVVRTIASNVLPFASDKFGTKFLSDHAALTSTLSVSY